MAIYSAVPPPPEAAGSSQHHQHTTSGASTVDIEAWTVSALEALSVSPIARGTGTPLSIPIDDAPVPVRRSTPGRRAEVIPGDHPAAGMTPPKRPLSRRDSQKRREAILKGKEGSRARRRWENGEKRRLPPPPSYSQT
jgi:hypothetical protein